MSDYGLMVWDASGNVVFDVTTVNPRLIGSFSAGTTDGSVTIPVPAGAEIMVTPRGSGAVAQITRTGNLFEWKYGSTPSDLRSSFNADVWAI